MPRGAHQLHRSSSDSRLATSLPSTASLRRTNSSTLASEQPVARSLVPPIAKKAVENASFSGVADLATRRSSSSEKNPEFSESTESLDVFESLRGLTKKLNKNNTEFRHTDMLAAKDQIYIAWGRHVVLEEYADLLKNKIDNAEGKLNEIQEILAEIKIHLDKKERIPNDVKPILKGLLDLLNGYRDLSCEFKKELMDTRNLLAVVTPPLEAPQPESIQVISRNNSERNLEENTSLQNIFQSPVEKNSKEKTGWARFLEHPMIQCFTNFFRWLFGSCLGRTKNSKEESSSNSGDDVFEMGNIKTGAPSPRTSRVSPF